MLISKQGDWISAKVGDEIVMMSAAEGKYIGLNDVGARIWELLDTPQSIDMLCSALVDEFEITPAVCHAEVTAFLADLRTYQAVGGPI